MRIAIVHSNPDSIKQLEQLITDLGYSISWSSESGQQALQNHQQDKPDLLLISLEITDMSGSELIQQIMQDTSATIIATCPSVMDNTAKVFQAMSYGALDALSEPHTNNKASLDDFKASSAILKSCMTAPTVYPEAEANRRNPAQHWWRLVHPLVALRHCSRFSNNYPPMPAPVL